jgi:hypothetical protein
MGTGTKGTTTGTTTGTTMVTTTGTTMVTRITGDLLRAKLCQLSTTTTASTRSSGQPPYRPTQ